MFKINKINDEYIKEIISWKYEAPYAFYNMEDNEETKEELKRYYPVLFENKLFGFFCVGQDAIILNKEYVYDSNYLDIGLGIHPLYCGKGCGEAFVRFGMDYFKNELKVTCFRLTVFDGNKRAIKVYEKIGFKPYTSFVASNKRFIVMLYD